jgi:hypothetical protein
MPKCSNRCAEGNTRVPFTEMERRFATLEMSTRELAVEVHGLTQNLVDVAHAEQRQRRFNSRVRVVGVALLVFVTLAAASIYAVLLAHVNQLIDNQGQAVYVACSQRNAANDVLAKRYRALAAVVDDPDVKAQVTALANDTARGAHVDCAAIANR